MIAQNYHELTNLALRRFFCTILIPFALFLFGSTSNVHAQLVQPRMSDVRSSQHRNMQVFLEVEISSRSDLCSRFKLRVFKSAKSIAECTSAGSDIVARSSELSSVQMNVLKKELRKVRKWSGRTKFAPGEDENNSCHWFDSSDEWIEIGINFEGVTRLFVHYLGCIKGSRDFTRELAKIENLEVVIETITGFRRWISEVNSIEGDKKQCANSNTLSEIGHSILVGGKSRDLPKTF